MGITFKTIIDLLCINAPILLTPKEKLDKSNYVSCKIMGDEETKAILSGTHNKEVNYDASDVGLHFPDIDVYEYYELEKARNPVGIIVCMEELSSQTIIPVEEFPIVWAIYSVLHEYGHWLHFKNSRLTSYEYCEKESEERQPHEAVAKKLRDMPDWYPSKMALAKRYHLEIYLQFTSEKYADEYAKRNFLEAQKRVREYFGHQK